MATSEGSFESVGAETESEGIGESVPEMGESGDEANEGDLGEHTPVSHTLGSAGATGSSAATGGETDEAADEAGVDESTFETIEGQTWDETVGQEAGAEEATLEATTDAYFVEADSQEFFQFLAPLILPVVKAAIPALAGAAAQQLPGGIRQVLQRIGRGRRPRRGRESDSEAGLDEAAIVQQLQQLEVVIGTDDRTQVTNTSVVPWRRICHLRIQTANGTYLLGTGFFIGPRVVITAGHCVYQQSQGGWPRSIEVSPGRNGSSRPFGQVMAVGLRSVRGWVTGHRRDYDYGAIILPRSGIRGEPGAFGFANYTTPYLMNKRLNTAGYPGDKGGTTMWYHGRRATQVTARTLVYDIDTAGGQSGSPVWVTVNGQRTVVGIHTNGAPGGNSATRITAPVFNNLRRWRQEGMQAGGSAGVQPARRAGAQPARPGVQPARQVGVFQED
jgi:V8-like Glu-specific endopeptidase